MLGISSSGKEEISLVVDDMFDTIALQLIGDIPRLKYKKLLLITGQRHLGLPNLFVQAMANRTPNPIEQDVLKNLLTTVHGYIEALKAKTKNKIAERVDEIVKKAKANKQKASKNEIEDAIEEELASAKSHMRAIVESEATKLRNVGSLMDISRVAASQGETDPMVFFVVVKDGQTCKECLRLHLNPDGSPRVWKFSELKQGYHKRGEPTPSAFGLHPHCRCTLTYLTKGFGFKDGRVTYIGEKHDEFAKQRMFVKVE